MTAGGQLQQVKRVHLDAVHAGDVAEGAGEALVLVVDDEGPQLLDATPVAQLADTGAHATGGVHAGNIGPGAGHAEEGDRLLGLLEALQLVAHHEGDLADGADLVAFGHDEGGHTGGGDSGAHGVPG